MYILSNIQENQRLQYVPDRFHIRSKHLRVCFIVLHWERFMAIGAVVLARWCSRNPLIPEGRESMALAVLILFLCDPWILLGRMLGCLDGENYRWKTEDSHGLDILRFGPFNLEVFAVFVGLTILLPWLLWSIWTWAVWAAENLCVSGSWWGSGELFAGALELSVAWRLWDVGWVLYQFTAGNHFFLPSLPWQSNQKQCQNLPTKSWLAVCCACFVVHPW